MHLRKLELNDAPFMLSWMHNSNVTKYLYTDFSSKTLQDCYNFIERAQCAENDVHYAIATSENEYVGTVSLKHICQEHSYAEFAIAIREEYMGYGYSWYGMKSMLEKAFSEYKLSNIYWCVSNQNNRAIHFYEKHNYHETSNIPDTITNAYKNANNLKWYCAHLC